MNTILTSYVGQNQLFNYAAVAGAALLAYDYFLTLDAEIDFVWHSRWSFAKMLFFILRYSAFLGSGANMTMSYISTLFQDHLCGSFDSASKVLMMITVFVSELVMVIRVCALYNGSRQVLVFLIALTMCATASTITISVMSQNHRTWVESPIPRLGTCIHLSTNVTQTVNFYAVFVVLMIFQFVLIILTIWKGVSQSNGQ
ncbi:uncharacterized protein FOMMEDRAFT_23360 [Fomitiporia mediterranea MF3/22]|uniref:uncharacterized protein n=1 Tax=Fomitiporia mediterranea (strain MF3/22) TaxID=694068 RepID=UPI0004408DA0|nr:uncharacterized protein FOMMEDRAFT_23360 [Fomitiporia mediterranea MF3/22]EJC98999.1 hypothetical protein FOMMEDRAFT_23360 [Fomitiporia mediterranea MF3/22]